MRNPLHVNGKKEVSGLKQDLQDLLAFVALRQGTINEGE